MENQDDKTKANSPLIETVRQESIQSRSENVDGTVTRAIGPTGFTYLLNSSTTLPPWWSAGRDRALSDFWKSINLLSGAMYTLTSKLTTIPFHIEPRDPAVTAHYKEAKRFERRLYESSEFGDGWGQFFSKQIQSLLGQDNGRFMEIIDMSPNKAGPIIGSAISVAHLAPNRCVRTGDPEFPVLYIDSDGARRKLHWTRVAFQSQLPSERVEMLGVGLCAVSRAASYAQNMADIALYKEEKLGSRPKRGMLLAGGGLDAESVGDAMQVTDRLSDNRGNKRYSLLPIVGSPDIEVPTLQLIELSQLPDGFNEEESTTIAMSAIALGFGIDARELWPNAQRGATRADALLSHIKQRGKGPGQILSETERMFNNWFLPPYLRMVFDYQDDAQDRQRAEIRRERSLTRKEDIANGISNERTERERMVTEGEISSAQFMQLELSDGRLPDGKPLGTLFFIEDEIYKEILTLSGVSNPLDFRANEPEKVLDAISKQIPVAYTAIARETGQSKSRRAQESLYALQWLEEQYEELLSKQKFEETQEEESMAQPSENRQGVREGADRNAEDESALNVRPDDESMLSSENDPRESKGKRWFEWR